MLKEVLGKVIESWKNQELNLAKPLSENEVVKSFSNFEITFSQDVIEVYSNFGGFEQDELDNEHFTFWTVKKILQENKQNAEYINFADFLIYSHLYAFKFENTENSAIYACFDDDRFKVADSFAEFFEIYLKNVGSLFP